jgi:hypothetical protein
VSQLTIAFRLQDSLGGPTARDRPQSLGLIIAIKHVHGWLASAGSVHPRSELDGERTHDRCVGVCYLESEDISEVMVRRGLGRDCPRFSDRRYAEAERQAAAYGATIGGVYPLPEYCRPR